MTRRNPAYNRAAFTMGAASYPQLPPDEGIEVAFCGRSNVGKSSAINAITGTRSLARVSKQPGRTQQINFFRIDDERHFVDLPGYGYAKVPLALKRKWEQLLERYLQTRQSLRGVILVMDIRRPLTEFDQLMLNWCLEAQMPVHILLTKADKLSRGAAGSELQKLKNALKKEFGVEISPTSEQDNYPVSVQIFSSSKKTGIEEAHAVLDHWFDYQ